jgi:hypothetical protein
MGPVGNGNEFCGNATILAVYPRLSGEEGARLPERSEIEGEAPQALPVEGALSPNNSSRFLPADRPDLACPPEGLSLARCSC